MTFSARELSTRTRLGLLTLAPILLVLSLVMFFPPDGLERSESAQFIGRFHLLAVHFPIVLILLVPILEIVGRSRRFPDLRPVIDFIMGFATLSASFAAILGWFLARSGGYSGSLLTQHMWGGICLAATTWLAWGLHLLDARKLKRWYVISLAITVSLVSFTGYRGGQLSQGEDHLTEYMPGPLRAVLGIPNTVKPVAKISTDASHATFYSAYIQPIFTAHCVGCHGPNKQKAKLRLDSYENLMRGASYGHVIRPGNPQGSELFERVTLPADDDDFMPADKKRPLSSSEVKLVELWISAGASGTMPANGIKNLPQPETTVAEVRFRDIDPDAVARERTALASAVSQLQQRFPNLLDYESRSSADLVIDASLWGTKFGDNELSEFAPVRERIVAADLSNTAITDRSASSIAAMKHLKKLNLMNDGVTDTTVEAFRSLSELESLNLFHTAVSAAALPAISELPKLQRVYVHETKVPPDASIPALLKEKISF
jgi:uncharacterized membrane protein